MNMKAKELITFLNSKADQYNQPSFISADPVSIPRLFTLQQDIEIAGFFAATFAWGNRTTIINKSKELMQRMDMHPYQFCLHAGKDELKSLNDFVHRTFQADDLYYFIDFFRMHFQNHDSLESAFTKGLLTGDITMENGLTAFKRYFFEQEHLRRTEKHIASPEQKSTCKRLNMYLRWMVRRDDKGVDFGIWRNISPSQLICPIDLHVARVARRLGILERKQTDWQAALELTAYLRTLDEQDPVKYDFALFGSGVMEKSAYA